FRGRGSAKEREVRCHRQFSICRHAPRSRKQTLQVPPRHVRRPYLAAVKSFAVEPHPGARSALDTEIIASQLIASVVAPPFHGDALGGFGARDLVRDVTPSYPDGWSVRHLGNRLNRLRACEQPQWPGRGKRVLLDGWHHCCRWPRRVRRHR